MSREKMVCPSRVVWRGVHGAVVGLVGGAALVSMSDLTDGKPANEVWENVFYQAPLFAFTNGFIMAFYSSMECTFEYARETQDPVNCFIAGGITGALLGSPHGLKQMAIFAAIGSLAFGILDGLL